MFHGYLPFLAYRYLAIKRKYSQWLINEINRHKAILSGEGLFGNRYVVLAIGLVITLRESYRELVGRVGEVKAPRGAKTAQVLAAMAAFNRPFSLAELESRCPGISRDMLRRLLRLVQQAGRLECLGRGPGALWSKRR